jgi:hypothetical protein
MSPEETIICFLERAFPVILVGGLLYMLARKFHLPWVAHLLARMGVGLLVALLIVAVLGEVRHVPIDMGTFFLVWVLLGLPVYLVRRWYISADARAAHEERLRQARGQERRRAPPPVGGAQAPTNPNPTQTTGGTP